MHVNRVYYISKLVRALWLVNLAFPTLLHGPLKCNLHDLYHQIFSTYIANKSLKLSFTLNYCVLKRANDLKMISNWFVLLLTCFRNLEPFLMNGNRCRALQTHNKDIMIKNWLIFSKFNVIVVLAWNILAGFRNLPESSLFMNSWYTEMYNSMANRDKRIL